MSLKIKNDYGYSHAVCLMYNNKIDIINIDAKNIRYLNIDEFFKLENIRNIINDSKNYISMENILFNNITNSYDSNTYAHQIVTKYVDSYFINTPFKHNNINICDDVDELSRMNLKEIIRYFYINYFSTMYQLTMLKIKTCPFYIHELMEIEIIQGNIAENYLFHTWAEFQEFCSNNNIQYDPALDQLKSYDNIISHHILTTPKNVYLQIL